MTSEVKKNLLLCPVYSHAVTMPERIALLTPDRTVNYGDLNSIVSACSIVLAATYSPHSLLAFKPAGTLEEIILLFAAWRCGIPVFLINRHLPDSLLTSYFSLLALHHSHCYLLSAQDVLSVVQDAPVQSQKNTFPDTLPSYMEMNQILTYMLTSGSTGLPKIAAHSFGNYYWNALGAIKGLGLDAQDQWMLTLPLYHVGGLGILFRLFICGGAVSLPGKLSASLHETLGHFLPSRISLVETQLARLLQSAPDSSCFSSLRSVLAGGGPVSSTLLSSALLSGLPVLTTYGLTEMSSQVTLSSPFTQAASPVHSGELLLHRELRLSEQDGEILVKGPSLFQGYLDPKGGDLVCPVDRNGWFHTGDLGYFTERNELLVSGRKDNMFISGGENIQPEEIEALLTGIPGICQAVVVGVPHPEYGKRPVAFIKRDDAGGGPEIEDIRQSLTKKTARFKLPDCFFDWPQEEEFHSLKPQRPLFLKKALQLLS